MSCFEKQSPMLGNDYAEVSLRCRNGSFAEFSGTRNGLRDYPYLSSNDTELTSYASATSIAPQQTPYQEDAFGVGDCMNANRTSPSTVYSYSSSGPLVDPLSLVSSSVPRTQNTSTKNEWWSENSRSNKDQSQTFGTPLSHDGLPRTHHQQPNSQYDQLWNTGGGSTNNWMNQQQSVAPATISPKALTLNVQPARMSPSGSAQGIVRASASPELTPSTSSNSSSEDDYPDYSTPEALNVIVSIRRPRQLLPDSIPMSKRVATVLPSNHFPREKGTRKRSLRSSDNHHREKSTAAYNSAGPTSVSSTKVSEPIRRPLPAPKRIEPKPVSPRSQHVSWADKPQSAATVQAMHHRDAKDDFLVRSKLAGMSYKEIRRQGKFTEAESTLRGRFRTLTKHKMARVRKPEWDDNDVCIMSLTNFGLG